MQPAVLHESIQQAGLSLAGHQSKQQDPCIIFLLAAVTGINQKLLKTSPLGEWSGLLQAILRLSSIKPIARALTQSPAWLGAIPGLSLRPDEGRQVLLTLLGPAFALAVLPDPQWTNATRPEPSVGQQCFSDVQNRRQSDVTASQHSLRLTMSSIVDSLHNISMDFLRNQVSRRAVSVAMHTYHGFYCDLVFSTQMAFVHLHASTTL